MKYLATLFLSLALVGCFHGEDRRTIRIDSTSSEVTISESEKVNVDVSGVSNVVTIKAGTSLGTLSISGVSNLVFFEEGATADRIETRGTSNSIEAPTGSGIAINEDTGLSNTISYY